MKGEKASANPWGSRSLEWTTASPPPGNFATPPKLDTGWTPYNYGAASAAAQS